VRRVALELPLAPTKRRGSAPYSVAYCRSWQVVAFQHPQFMHRARLPPGGFRLERRFDLVEVPDTLSDGPFDHRRPRRLLDLAEERRELLLVEAAHDDIDHFGVALHAPSPEALVDRNRREPARRHRAHRQIGTRHGIAARKDPGEVRRRVAGSATMPRREICRASALRPLHRRSGRWPR